MIHNDTKIRVPGPMMGLLEGPPDDTAGAAGPLPKPPAHVVNPFYSCVNKYRFHNELSHTSWRDCVVTCVTAGQDS